METQTPVQTGSQADPTTEFQALVRQATLGAEMFTSAVTDLMDHDIESDQFTDKDKEYLEAMAGQIVHIPGNVKSLKRMFKDHMGGPEKKKARKGPKEGEFGTEGHATELFNLATEAELELHEFMRALKVPEHKGEDAIENGYYDALSKVVFTPEQLSARLEQHSADLVPATIVESATSVTLGAGFSSVHKSYTMCSDIGDMRGTTWLLQQISQRLHVLTFATEWSKYQGAGSKKKKGEIFEKMFLGNEKGELSEKERKSTDFQKHKNRLRDDIRGANRFLNAYNTLGVIVIFHPHLEFRYFRNSNTGSLTSALTRVLHDKLSDTNHLSNMENTRRALLWAILATLCPDSSELKCQFRKVLQAASKMDIQGE
ncbi:hypothetical protein FRC08_004965 [Ceratobasidium sp. 394]|nr:hypothetical protein FRC08_004965 [Ceratobasidium sp. 394]